MSVEDFLADVKKEGSDPFAAMEKETPADSPAADKPTDEDAKVEPSAGANTQEKEVPFHKHPRWIERETELQQLRQAEQQHAHEIAELKTMRQSPTAAEIPKWFEELYGKNEVAWNAYRERELQREGEIEQRVLQRQYQAQYQQQAEVQHWSKWVDTEIQKLEGEGKTFDRNKLIKTMLDYRPTDEQNNFDFKKGFDIYKALNPDEDPAKSDARKQLADTTTKSSRGEKPKKDYMTPAELRNRSWASL